MRKQHEDHMGRTPRQVADTLILTLGGRAFRGSAEDEELVATVARCWASARRYAVRAEVVVRRGGETAGPAAPAAVPAAARRTRLLFSSGHVCRQCFRGRARRRRALMMPPDLGAALQHNLGAGGVLPALPLDVADLHAEQRGATHSVRRKRAQFLGDGTRAGMGGGAQEIAPRG